MPWPVEVNLGPEWTHFALAGVYLVGGYLVSRGAKYVARWVLGGLVARTRTTLDDRLSTAFSGSLGTLVFLGGIRLALRELQAPPGVAGSTLFDWAEKALFAAAVLVIALVVNRSLQIVMDWYLHEVATRSHSTWDRDLLPVLRWISLVLVLFVAVSIILDHYGASITALVTTAGVASLAVALAAQDTLANMIAGFTILVDRPFRVGDVIELKDGHAGEVVEVGLRSTKIRRFDGNAVVIPNKDIAGSMLTNFAFPDPRRAIRQTIGVAYGTDLVEARAVLLTAMQEQPGILPDPEPAVYFTNFGDSALELLLVCWVGDYRDWFRIKDELLMAIWQRLQAQGIVIPFPQRDVHLYPHDATK